MKKARWFAFVLLFVLFLVQNAVSYVFPWLALSLVLVGVIYYALAEGPLFGLILGAYAGIYLEIFGYGKLGYQMAILAAVGAFCGFLASKVFKDSFFTHAVLPALCLYLAALLNLIVFKTLGEETVTFSVVGEAFLVKELFLTAAVSPFIFAALNKMSPNRSRGRVRWPSR